MVVDLEHLRDAAVRSRLVTGSATARPSEDRIGPLATEWQLGSNSRPGSATSLPYERENRCFWSPAYNLLTGGLGDPELMNEFT